MDVALGVPETKGKARLRSFKGLALALLIHTEDLGIFRRIQLQPHTFTDIFHEKGVGGKLKVPITGA